MYCAGDGNSTTVCDCDNHIDVESTAGKMSPHRMLTTTFSDELKLFSPQSKVFGISIKIEGQYYLQVILLMAPFGWVIVENGFLARTITNNYLNG